MRTIAERLADFAADIAAGRAAEQTRRMELYALDTLAVMLAGTVSPSSAPMLRTILSACGKAEATVMAEGRVTSAWDAALANGAFAHALELDDDHRIAVLHPGAVIVPAALAAAEAANASGLAFLRALLVGYEVTCRLGEVFRGSLFDHAMHPTGVCGIFGAAGAASVAMGLDRDAFVRALGIAGTQAAGLTEWRADGSWIKRLHPGRSAHGGVLAARLSKEGFTGPATIFEGEGGFFRAFAHTGPMDQSCMTRDLGQDFRALGTAIKPYPCCRFEHGAVDLALEAAESGIGPDDIASVGVRIYRTNVLSYHKVPKNAVDAQFNVPYAVAVAFVKKAVRLADFTEEGIKDAAVLALAQRVDVEEDAAFTAKYPQEYFVELKIKLRDGTARILLSDCPSGDPEAKRYRSDPALLASEVRQKAAALLAECGFGERALALEACVAELGRAPNLTELSSILGARRGEEESGRHRLFAEPAEPGRTRS
jgi:2-methylcitrate dehydratase PrpD